MNQKIYKMFGTFLTIATFVIIIIFIFSHLFDTSALTRGYGQSDYFYDIVVKGIFPSIITFILGFFPGIFFLHLSKTAGNPSKLIKSAAILQIISVVVTLVAGIVFFLPCIKYCDGLGEGLLFVTIGVPSLAIYSFGVLLLLVYKLKTTQQQ